jgi:hypothetical protein
MEDHMLPGYALISLSLCWIAAPAIQAQVRERTRSVPVRPPIIVTPAPEEGTYTLARPMAGPTNLTATGTPAMASLRWDAAPTAIGYHVSRADPAGATVRLTPNPIAETSFQDLSGGVKPGIAYTYHVTAAYSNGRSGTAQVSFTPPAPTVPDSVRVEPRGGEMVLLWGSVPGAGSYEIFESWMQPVQIPVYSTVYSAEGKASTVLTGYTTRMDHKTRTHVLPAPQSSLSLGTSAKGHRYDVGAAYSPGGVTAPRSQWKYVVVP